MAAAYALVRRALSRRRGDGPRPHRPKRRLDPHLLGLLVLVMLPDADRHVPWLAHRGLTHTVWFAVLVGATLASVAILAAAVSGAGVSPRRAAARSFVVGAGAMTLHLVGDVLTPMGIRPFTPLYGEMWTFSLVYAADPRANAALFGAGAAALAVGRLDALGGVSTPLRRLRRALRVRVAGVRRDP